MADYAINMIDIWHAHDFILGFLNLQDYELNGTTLEEVKVRLFVVQQ